jgi:hypothetical protein
LAADLAAGYVTKDAVQREYKAERVVKA